MERTVIGGTPTYMAVSPTLVSSGTAASTTISLGILWHAATVSKVYKAVEIGASWAGGAGGTAAQLFVGRVTADGTGGTVVNAAAAAPGTIGQALSNAPASDASFRSGATGAPTRGAAIYGASISLGTPGERSFFFETTDLDDQPDTMRGGQAEGIEIYLVTGGTGPTTAASLMAHAKWVAL